MVCYVADGAVLISSEYVIFFLAFPESCTKLQVFLGVMDEQYPGPRVSHDLFFESVETKTIVIDVVEALDIRRC